MNNLEDLISQMEQQKDALERAIAALREVSQPSSASVKRLGEQSTSGAAGKRRATQEDRQELTAPMKERSAVKRAQPSTGKKDTPRKREVEPAAEGGPLQGRSMTKEQKQAISNSWTPERKQKFAEFHVRRMALAKGADPVKALRDYRRRKQNEQANVAPTAKSVRKAPSKKAARP